MPRSGGERSLFQFLRHAAWLALVVVGFAFGWLLYLLVLGPIFGYGIGDDAL